MKFPMEGNARKYITTEVVTVDSTAYYRHAVQDGDLILVTDGTDVAVGAEQNTGTTKAKTQSKKEKQVGSDE
ncbi:TPA: DUF2635 domain-containing protein [Escherichia coli]|nr:DUF2635 domain-containing protein [Escherichia coli]HAX5184831.1 DUF2635 domain-containing protein [Escherichia coli]HAX5231309.1 DUF2635 domain-containing protein [Escherichia coli]HAX5272893.1 DUF2635 domain-containing protein [Escherichia coli]